MKPRQPPSQAEAVILAGGRGTRLRDVIGNLPKVIARVGGRPLLFHLLDRLGAQGVGLAVLALGHGHQEVADCLKGRSESIPRTTTVVEKTPLGTAGAVRFAASRLSSDPFFVLNGDTYSRVPLDALMSFHLERRALVTIAATGRSDPGRYGSLETDAAGRVVRFREKGVAEPGLVNAGTYVVSRSVLAGIPDGTNLSWENDILPGLVGHGLFAFEGTFEFLDIGTPESYREASRFLECK